MVCLKMNDYDLSSSNLLKQYFFNSKCLQVDSVDDLIGETSPSFMQDATKALESSMYKERIKPQKEPIVD